MYENAVYFVFCVTSCSRKNRQSSQWFGFVWWFVFFKWVGLFSRSKLLIFTSGEILNKGILNPNSSCVPEEHSPRVHSPYIGLWTWEVQTKLIFLIEDRCKTFLIVIRSSCYCWISQAAWLALRGSSYHSSSLRDFSVAFLLLWEFPGCAKNRTYCIPFLKKKNSLFLLFLKALSSWFCYWVFRTTPWYFLPYYSRSLQVFLFN